MYSDSDNQLSADSVLDKKLARWHKLACAKDDTRLILRLSAIENGKVFSADGYHMHVSKIDHENAALYHHEDNRAEGRFPDFNAIIPQEFSARASVNVHDLRQALKIVGVLNKRAVRLTFTGTHLILTTITDIMKKENHGIKLENLDTCITAIPCVSPELTITLNLSYVQDALSFWTKKNDSVTMSFNGGDRPAVIGTTDQYAMIMPMSLLNDRISDHQKEGKTLIDKAISAYRAEMNI